jgi:hypothetical protein
MITARKCIGTHITGLLRRYIICHVPKIKLPLITANLPLIHRVCLPALEILAMSHAQWLGMCQSAANTSIDDLLLRFSASYSSVGFFCGLVCAISLVLSILYFRLPPDQKNTMWRRYAWFVGSVCASSFMSFLAWGAANGFAGHAFIYASNISS